MYSTALNQVSFLLAKELLMSPINFKELGNILYFTELQLFPQNYIKRNQIKLLMLHWVLFEGMY
jgi:hypothetical protein